jgi:hypothetical protein
VVFVPYRRRLAGCSALFNLHRAIPLLGAQARARTTAFANTQSRALNSEHSISCVHNSLRGTSPSRTNERQTACLFVKPIAHISNPTSGN